MQKGRLPEIIPVSRPVSRARWSRSQARGQVPAAGDLLED
ncbi:hypothetical protein P3T39_001419 [Kitasatospora sp. GP82]|nr:hypothetical protein [Kitasatospora sp. GP82]